MYIIVKIYLIIFYYGYNREGKFLTRITGEELLCISK